MFLKYILFFSWGLSAYSADYRLIDFLAGQRTLIPRSELETKIESQQRVDFRELSCELQRGIFSKFILPEGRDSLVIIGEKQDFTKNALEYLKTHSKFGRELLSILERSPHKIYIQESHSRSFLNLKVGDQYEHNNAYAVTILEKSSLNLEDDRVPLNKLGGSSVVVWNPKRQKGIKDQAITLAHELYHAFDAARGKLDYRLVSGDGYESTAVVEYRGVYFENLVRKELGMKPRLKYSADSAGSLKNLWIDRPCLTELQ